MTPKGVDMTRKCFKITIFVLLIYQVIGKLDVASEIISCNLTSEKFWNIYYDHLTTSRNIVLKVLTFARNEHDVIDFATAINYLINSLPLSSTLKIFTKYERQTRVKDLPLVNVSYRPAKYTEVTKYNDTLTVMTFFRELQDLCIIIVHNEENLLSYLQDDETIFFESIQKRYIIVFTKKEIKCHLYSNVTARLLVKLWKDNRILNVIASTPCLCHPENFYIYRPFIKFGNTGQSGTVEVQSGYKITNHWSLLVNEPRNLHGMSLKVSLFERNVSLLFKRPKILKYSQIYNGRNKPKYYGVDGMVLNEISKYMNFTIDIDDINTYFGTIMHNGTVTGSLGKVIQKKVELAANARFIEYYHPQFDYTNPVVSDKLCIIVPNSAKMPQFLIILTCFDTISWICIFAIIFMSIMIWHVHNKIINRTDAGFIEIYSMIMGTSVIIPNRFQLSVLVIVCSFANIIFSNLFQGILYTHFSKITYFSNIDTLEELVRRNLTISTTLRVFHELNYSTHEALRKRIVDTSDRNQSAAPDVAFYKNTSILERLSDAKLMVQMKYLDNEGHPRLYIVKECLNTYLLAYIFPRISPYKYYFNYVITKLAESGLIEKWNNDIYDAVGNKNENKEDNWRMLNNNDLQIAYIVLITGNTIASIFFLREIFAKWKQQCRH